MDFKKIGAAIKRIREARNMTQAQVDTKAHFKSGICGQAESGEIEVKAVVTNIAEVLDIPLSLLMLISHADEVTELSDDTKQSAIDVIFRLIEASNKED